MEVPIDCPAALAAYLRERGRDAVPTPLPDDFMDRLPITCLSGSGGSRTWPVTDSHRVGVDVYAATMGEAMEEAALVYATLDAMNDVAPTLDGVQVYRVGFGGLPQESDDPDHPDAPMATFLCEVTCRARHLD